VNSFAYLREYVWFVFLGTLPCCCSLNLAPGQDRFAKVIFPSRCLAAGACILSTSSIGTGYLSFWFCFMDTFGDEDFVYRRNWSAGLADVPWPH